MEVFYQVFGMVLFSFCMMDYIISFIFSMMKRYLNFCSGQIFIKPVFNSFQIHDTHKIFCTKQIKKIFLLPETVVKTLVFWYFIEDRYYFLKLYRLP